MQKHVKTILMEQMQTNADRNKRKLEKTKLTEAVNMGAVNDQLYNEAAENLGKRQKDIHDYRGAWNNQVAQTINKKNVDAIVQGAVFWKLKEKKDRWYSKIWNTQISPYLLTNKNLIYF